MVDAVSLVGGRLSDRVGRLPMMIAMAVTQIAAQACAFLSSPASPALYYVTTALLGTSDALVNTQLYSTIGFLFADRLGQSFAGTPIARHTTLGWSREVP